MKLFTNLIKAKSTKCIASHNGRVLYEVQITPAWRQKHMDMFSRLNEQHPDFELLRKEQITGNSSDNGWVLIDKTKQNKEKNN